MDQLGNSIRGFSEPPVSAARVRSEVSAPAVADAAEPSDTVTHSEVRDEALLHPMNVQLLSAEALGDMHKKVDLPETEPHEQHPEQAPESYVGHSEAESSARMQPDLTDKSRSLADQAIRQRTSERGTEQNAVQAQSPQAEATVADTRLLADGVVPSMMEGLLNQLHRKDSKSKKDAAKFLLVILKAHGAYVYDHCTRLVDLAMSLAQEMGEESEQLRSEVEEGMAYRDLGEVAFFLTKRSARQRDALAAYLGGNDLAQESMLHDVGKIQVPEEVLMKPAPLDEKERIIMQRHPIWGAEILAGIPPLHHAIPVTRHHHERWDGDGYPDRKKGEEIPLAARIVSVVDAFDAMVSDRPYRKGLPFEEACLIISEGSGTQFDPRVASAFLRIAHKVWSPERQY